MSNETLQGIQNRKSVRVFEKKDIPEEIRSQLLEAALQAPTAGNQILYTILDIRDQTLKDSLAKSCDHQPFIATAPMVLVFLADCRRWMDIYREADAPHRAPGPGDLLLACADALIAAQNTVVAAHSLGIGSCYIGDIIENCEQHRSVLHLDQYTVPVCMVVYGYPTEQQKSRPKPLRFNRQYIVQQNTYRPLSPQQIRTMFTEVHPQPEFDFNSYIQAFCARKYMSDFSLEMSRSAADYLKSFSSWVSEE